MLKGSLRSARVRIGFGYQDAKNNGVTGFGGSSESQLLSRVQDAKQAKLKHDRDVARLQQLPDVKERAIQLLKEKLTPRQIVRELKRLNGSRGSQQRPTTGDDCTLKNGSTCLR